MYSKKKLSSSKKMLSSSKVSQLKRNLQNNNITTTKRGMIDQTYSDKPIPSLILHEDFPTLHNRERISQAVHVDKKISWGIDDPTSKDILQEFIID
mmetsp:Transcript_14467/g.12744  ORF Transcript_14467/g.12744 Transcript_14467/m.12744 type:complete len:96 (+) Transcript_14467:203-490(+)